MLLKFPFRESGERGLYESNMRRHESVVHKRMAQDKNFAKGLALVSVVIFIQVKARTNGDPVCNSTFQGSRDGMKVH